MSSLQAKILNTDDAIKYAGSTAAVQHMAYVYSGGKTSGGGRVEYVKESSVTQNYNASQKVRFRIGTSQGNRNIETCSLVFETTAGVRAAGDLKFIEGAAVSLVQSIEFRQKGVIIETYNTHQIYNKLKQSNTPEVWDNVIKYQLGISDNVVGNISANTNAPKDAKAVQTHVLELNRFVDFLGKQVFPIWLLNDSELEIVVELTDNFANLCDVAPDTAPTVNDMYIVNEYVEIPDITVQELSKPENPVQLYNLKPNESKFTLLSGSTEYKVKLSELKSQNVTYLDFFIVQDSDLGRLPFNYRPVTSYNLISKGNKIANSSFDITDTFYRSVILSDINPCNMKDAQKSNNYLIAYTSDMDAELRHKSRVVNSFLQSHHGARYFIENDATLELKFSALGGDSTLFVHSWSYDPLKIYNQKILRSGQL